MPRREAKGNGRAAGPLLCAWLLAFSQEPGQIFMPCNLLAIAITQFSGQPKAGQALFAGIFQRLAGQNVIVAAVIEPLTFAVVNLDRRAGCRPCGPRLLLTQCRPRHPNRERADLPNIA